MAIDDQAVATASERVQRLITITGQIEQTRVKGEQRLAHAAGAGTRRVAFSGVGDSCELCQALDGIIFEADSPAAARYSPPLHINCNCLWVEVDDDEVGDNLVYGPEHEAQLSELVARHGHFVSQPEKYAPLKIPARPDGRDFTFRRGKAGQPGRVEWTRPRYDLPGLDPETIQEGAKGQGRRWQPIGGGPEPPKSPAKPVGPGGGGQTSFASKLADPSSNEGGTSRGLALSRHKAIDNMPAYQTAETTEAVEALLQASLPDSADVSLVGMDVVSAREFAAQLAEMADKWPEATDLLRAVVAKYDEGATWIARLVVDNGEAALEINIFWSDAAGLLEALARDQELAGVVPAGCGSISGIAAEEFGHLIKAWLDTTSQGEVIDQWLTANLLPGHISMMRGQDLASGEPERIRQEQFARGIMMLVGTPEREEQWLLGFRAMLDRGVRNIRNH